MAVSVSTHTAEAKLQAFRGLRLPPDEERLLRFLFCDFEAACGVKSTLAGQIALLESGTRTDGGGPLVGEDMLYQPERWADGSARKWGVTRDAVARRRGVLRTLADRDDRHVMVLYRAYGPRDPSAPWLTFGQELAPLACLTRAADELGVRRVAREGGRPDAKQALLAALRRKGPERLDLIARVRDEAEKLLVTASKAYLRVLDA